MAQRTVTCTCTEAPHGGELFFECSLKTIVYGTGYYTVAQCMVTEL